jgi:hypothetical protein
MEGRKVTMDDQLRRAVTAGLKAMLAVLEEPGADGADAKPPLPANAAPVTQSRRGPRPPYRPSGPVDEVTARRAQQIAQRKGLLSLSTVGSQKP